MSASLIKRNATLRTPLTNVPCTPKNMASLCRYQVVRITDLLTTVRGFCVFNDVCVASNLLLARGQAKRILSVDLDVHQGNGNASIMANNPAVFVFSIHGKRTILL